MRFEITYTWVQIAVLLLNSCVTLDKLFSLFELLCLRLQNSSNAYLRGLIGLSEKINEIAQYLTLILSIITFKDMTNEVALHSSAASFYCN